MALITCPECGAQISDKAECCPKCGIPMKENDENVSSCDNNDNVQKKKMLVWIIGIIVMCVMALCIVYATTRSAEEIVSHETETEANNNIEKDIKETLDPDAKIVAEISNSKVKKLYYLDNNDGTNRLMSYNYNTGTTKIISESGLWWMDWKLAGDRLFYTTNSGACGYDGIVSGVSVSYLDTNDDSEHLVTECSEAEFDGYNRIKITKMSATDTRGASCDYKYDSREYYLDLFASESEYERSRQEQQRIEEDYEQQRNQQQIMQDLEWIQGNWRYVTQIYGVTVDTRVGIHENMIVVMHDGEFDYRGSYTIDGNQLIYYYGDGTAGYIVIDRVNRRLMFDDTHAFQRF